jgi:uncharacterized membrane protein YtjA (UPF0391 family)
VKAVIAKKDFFICRNVAALINRRPLRQWSGFYSREGSQGLVARASGAAHTWNEEATAREVCQSQEKIQSRSRSGTNKAETTTNHMLSWAITFLVIALIAAVLGFGGIAGAAVGIAKILFFVFLVLCVLFFFLGRRAPGA